MNILSLEEIENYERWAYGTYEYSQDLVNTARAYHELMAIYNDNPTRNKSTKDINEEAFEGITSIVFEKPEYVIKAEEKPHAPTIKAVIEALKHGENANHEVVAKWAIQSLESILKEL